MKLSLQFVAQAMGASASGLTGEVSRYSIDSRTVKPGDLFIAIVGDTHDGHTFVEEVLAKGAAAAVVSRDLGEDPRLIRVDETLRALQALAAVARRQWDGRVVGVTGSAGKTSTKDIIASMLELDGPVGRTRGNFNNHIGLPLSVLGIPDEARVAVLELGMNHAGEIRQLAEIARPDIAVVTNVGHAHIENFEDGIEGIALAKRELVEALPQGGVAVLNYEDPRVRAFGSIPRAETVYYGFSPEAEVRAGNVELNENGVRFHAGSALFESDLIGRHAVLNILAGIAVARVLGIDEDRLPAVVRSLRPGKMRGELRTHNGIRIIDDCYNSNPDALRTMVEVLRDFPAQRHIAVLGEMLELGHWSESLHREAGFFVARCGISVLVGIRGVAEALVKGAIEAGLQKDAAYFFPEPCEAGEWLRTFALPGDTILFKGSRGTHVEKALEKFLV
ncbi:MAG: UDP-N-acetylmuramoyl-tripeptide--D-alanyl-D-alanine ligase [Bryobacteraceae bacterium]|nr:UDP-N-acetylmuramoyl-tripeptide--D-alanyl-D-alanine ligase [Bryobacteraceae bacterium]